MASTDDTGPLSLDNFRKNNFSASWRVAGVDNSNVTSEVRKNDVLLPEIFAHSHTCIFF